MSATRILVLILTCAAWCVSNCMAADLPVFGTWDFTGKDTAGVVWKGTVTISALDTNRFDTGKYQFMWDVNLTAGKASRGTEGPCAFDASTRAITCGVRNLSAYTAILSADGKSLTQGKWTEWEGESGLRSQPQKTVKSSGTWTAKFNK